MRSFSRLFLYAGLLTVPLLAGPLPSQAQFAYKPGTSYPAAQTQATVNTPAPQQQPPVVYQQPPPPPPAYGYPYYPMRMTPTYGYLSGAAEVTNANAQYQQTIQQARMTREQSRQMELDTRRKTFDELRYEKAMTPTPEDLRQQELAAQLQRSRRQPPRTEIWSGDALNSLLGAIQQTEATQGVRGPAVPLNPEVVSKINVTTETTRGSVGILKDGTLRWPLALKKDRFAPDCARIDELTARAVRYAAAGNTSDDSIGQLIDAVKALQESIRAAAPEISPNDYIQAMRYANELYDAVRVLPTEGATNYLTGKWAARGQTVGELVNNMTQNGLKFAPATEGTQSYYTAFYQSLLAYDSALGQLTTPVASANLQSSPPMGPR